MSARFAVLAAAVAALSGCAAAPPADPLRALQAEHCGGVGDSFECARAIEHALILERNDVRRQGERLTLVLANGRVRTLTDVLADNATHTRYSYVGSLPVGYHVVHLHLYEGDSYLLIDSMTGKQTVSAGVPVLSPDRRRVAQTSFDAYDPSEMSIWRVEPQGLVAEFEHVFAQGLAGPGAPRWDGSSRVSFALSCRDGVVRGSGSAVLRGESWQLDAAARPLRCD